MTSVVVTGAASRVGNSQVGFVIQATGNDFGNVGNTAFSQLSGVGIIYQRNDFLYGVTGAAYLTGGAGTFGINRSSEVKYQNGLSADFASSYPVNENVSGFSKDVPVSTTETGLGASDAFRLYVAYPARMHNESWPTTGVFRFTSVTQPLGGMTLQGYRGDPGLSTVSYTNQEGYTENYKIWRSDETYTSNGFPTGTMFIQIAFS
jgi:hypothetical protein